MATETVKTTHRHNCPNCFYFFDCDELECANDYSKCCKSTSSTGERRAESTLVRWCPVGETWEPDDHPDSSQPQACSGCNPVHYLRRRRMLICSVCQQACATQKGFNRHDCFDAY